MKYQDEIVDKFLDGESVIDLAKDYGMTREAIYLRLRKLPNWRRISRLKRKQKTMERISKYEVLLPEVIGLRKQGIGTYKIAMDLGVPYEVLRELLKGTRYDNRPSSRSRRNKRVLDAYKSGKSQVEIAKDFKLGQSTVSMILLKLCNGQLPKRPRKRK